MRIYSYALMINSSIYFSLCGFVTLSGVSGGLFLIYQLKVAISVSHGLMSDGTSYDETTV